MPALREDIERAFDNMLDDGEHAMYLGDSISRQVNAWDDVMKHEWPGAPLALAAAEPPTPANLGLFNLDAMEDVAHLPAPPPTLPLKISQGPWASSSEMAPIERIAGLRTETAAQVRERLGPTIYQEKLRLLEEQGALSPVVVEYHHASGRARIKEGEDILALAEELGATHIPARVVRRNDAFPHDGTARSVAGFKVGKDGWVPSQIKPSSILDGGPGVPKPKDPEEVIRAAEDRIHLGNKETGIILDPVTGDILAEIPGSAHAVKLNAHLDKLPGATFTHNHPNDGGSLSWADFEALLDWKGTMRAVDRNWRYTMRIDGPIILKETGTSVDRTQLRAAFDFLRSQEEALSIAGKLPSGYESGHYRLGGDGEAHARHQVPACAVCHRARRADHVPHGGRNEGAPEAPRRGLRELDAGPGR